LSKIRRVIALSLSKPEGSLAPPTAPSTERRAVEGPDFIYIGMEKAGSDWLYDQLQAHPDFWMPPIKGLHYLDDPHPQMKNAKMQLERLEKRRGRSRKNRRPLDDKDEKFLRDLLACSGQPRDLDRYVSFFRYKDGKLSGDVTAPYALLREEVIREVGQRLPDVKVVLLVRDPVARAWSHLSMAHREGKFDDRLLQDASRFRSFVQNSHSIKTRSFASKVLERWRMSAPAVQLQYFFFDDIANDSVNARSQILCYLEADPEKKSGDLQPDYNRKAKAAKLRMTDSSKEVLVEHFAEELRACATLFGGHAVVWKLSYGV
jgi:hypothetical protein